MKKIRQYLHNRRVRKLAERLLASQILYTDKSNQLDRIDCAIQTAKKFYEQWKELAK